MKFSHTAGTIKVMSGGKAGNMNAFIFGKPTRSGRHAGNKKKRKISGKKR